MDLLCAFWSASVFLAVSPHTIFPYETPKELLAVIGAFGVLVAAIAGPVVLPSESFAWMSALVVVWWLGSCGRSRRPDIGMRYAGRWCLSLIAVCLAGPAGIQGAMQGLSLAGLIDAAYGTGRLIQGYGFPGEEKNQIDLTGLQGNANYCGFAHLVCVFCGLDLGGWYLVPAAVSIAVVVRSQCRFALAGLCAGVVALAMASGELLVGGVCLALFAAAFAWAIRIKGMASFGVRRAVWRACATAMGWDWVGGVGPDALRTVLPLAIVRERENGGFPPKYHEIRAHSDVVQIVADVGAMGFGLLLGLIGVASFAHDGAHPAMIAGVVALIVAGIGFHGLALAPMQIGFFLMLARLCPADKTVTLHPLAWAVAVIAAASWIIVPALTYYWVRILIQHALYAKFARLGEALGKAPQSTFANTMMTQAALIHQRPVAAVLAAQKAIVNYDGEVRMDECLRCGAAAYHFAGAADVAKTLAGFAAAFDGGAPK